LPSSQRHELDFDVILNAAERRVKDSTTASAVNAADETAPAASSETDLFTCILILA
jgi:hypothetical protein